jgi:hypothetical protein
LLPMGKVLDGGSSININGLSKNAPIF